MVCTLPAQFRRKLNSTNMLERVMRELKQRTKVVGIFPNEASCDRLIGARLMELEEAWSLEERDYLNTDQLEREEYREAVKKLAA